MRIPWRGALARVPDVLVALLITAWLAGRVVSDRVLGGQWLLWIPTLVPLTGASLMVAIAFAPGGGAGRRRRAWLVVTAMILLSFAFVEHRFLRFPSAATTDLKLVHCTPSQHVVDHPEFGRALVALDGDVTIVTNPGWGAWPEQVGEWLGPDSHPHRIQRFAILTRLPVRQLRHLVLTDDVAVALVEIDATSVIGRSLVMYLVDLPSNPRASRSRIAQRVRRYLDAAAGLPPDLLVGDFNMTRGSAALRLISGEMPHAFALSGHGYGATFPRRWPAYHIDHVFVGPDLACSRYDLVDPGAGRHRAQVAYLRAGAPPPASAP